MTPETNLQQRLNAQLVSISVPREQEEEEEACIECEHCGQKPEDQGHRCNNCDEEISETRCKSSEGFCSDCWAMENWAAKLE